MSQIDDLKKDLEGWVEYTKDSRQRMLDEKANLKVQEDKLKRCKYEFNQANKAWVYGRKQQKKIKSKISVLPGRLRKWGKDNPDKMIHKFIIGED